MTEEQIEIQALPEEHTVVDYLLISDYAEVINGKTYIVGGGWDTFTPPIFPALVRLGVAVGIRVPFLESNIPHHMTITLRTDETEHFRMEGDVETGRLPGARGESTLVQLAVNAQFNLLVPQTLELRADVDGSSSKRISIRALGHPG